MIHYAPAEYTVAWISKTVTRVTSQTHTPCMLEIDLLDPEKMVWYHEIIGRQIGQSWVISNVECLKCQDNIIDAIHFWSNRKLDAIDYSAQTIVLRQLYDETSNAWEAANL